MKFAPALSEQGLSVRSDGVVSVWRKVPAEVPVAMVYDGATQAVMMASPTDIADFAHGFALSEGFVTSLDQILNYEEVAHESGIEARFWLREDRSAALAARRRSMAGPVGCGLCGIESLEQAMRALPVVGGSEILLSVAEVATATESLRAFQPLHDQTHAVHAAGFLMPGKGIILAREDVGRHNALDKLIGAMALQGLDARAGAFVMTSRLSVELVQKCAMAGCPVLIAASAPTALALQLANSAGITIAAFVRSGGFDLYSHPGRIPIEANDVA